MIPKIIHYCWFSGAPFPVEVKLCMDTWEKVLPDFTLRLWTMEDALSLNYTYVNEALQAKKWAFAADVVRVYALYNEGGVYMDSDIFLLDRFDQFMKKSFTTFHECKVEQFIDKEEVFELGHEVPFGLQAAFMIGEKGNVFCKSILDYYKVQHFVNPDGSYNLRIAPYIYAEVAEKYGLKYVNREQHLEGGINIYDSKYFGQTKRDRSPETFGVHRISHGWKNLNDYPFFKRTEKKIKHYFRVFKYSLLKR